jgi:twitching motility protein PilT
MFVLNDLLNLVIENGASDLHITVGTPPVIRVDGELIQTDLDVLTPMDTRSLIYNVLTAEQQKEFEENFELDMSYSVHGFGRFRVNVYKQRGCIGAAFRIIPTKIPSLEELRLPKNYAILRACAKVWCCLPAQRFGQINFAGLSDQHHQRIQTCHIMTIEDPMNTCITISARSSTSANCT